MTSAVGITSIGSSALTAQATAASTHHVAATSTSLAPPPVQSISPHIVVDPVAGIITQYLNSAGKVETQFPSNTVVAYLKAGLTSDGRDRHPATTKSEHTSATA